MSNFTYLEEVIRAKPCSREYTDVHSTSFHFPFEKIDHLYWSELISSNWKLPIYAGVAYIIVIFGLQSWIRDRPAYDLKGPLFWWNLVLGLFSITGFVRVIPGFLQMLAREGGLYTSICVKRTIHEVPFEFWALLFIFSKFVELGDTVLIVLRKRPLIFLQWYHHLVTMSVTWILAPLAEPVLRWYTVLNLGVHSLMYPYFALRARGKHVPIWMANLITTFQFLQMLIGLGVNMASTYYRISGHNCVRYGQSIQMFGVVYGSFVILFGKLFYDSVIKGRKVKQDKSGNTDGLGKKLA